MASKGGASVKRRVVYSAVHRYTGAICLLAFFVVVAATVRSTSSVISVSCAMTIARRASIVILVIALISRILVKAWASFEEMNRGKA